MGGLPPPPPETFEKTRKFWVDIEENPSGGSLDDGRWRSWGFEFEANGWQKTMTGTESADEFLNLLNSQVLQNLVIIYTSHVLFRYGYLHPQKTNMDTQNDGLGSSIGSTCDRQEASRPSVCPDCTCRKVHWHRTWKWSCDRWLWSSSHSWHQSCKLIGMIIILKPFWILAVLDDKFVIIKRNDEFHGCKYFDTTNIFGLFLFAW